MRGHPAYEERPPTLETAPQTEPYVPFGVGEVLGWSAEDIKKLPGHVERGDDWEWRCCIQLNLNSHEEVQKRLMGELAGEAVVGLGYSIGVVDIYRTR